MERPSKSTKLLSINSKMAKSSAASGAIVLNFGIPAYRSRLTGKRTCPSAGICAQGCYAQAGSYRWSAVEAAYEWRLHRTAAPTFPAEIGAELDRWRRVRSRKRITSGDGTGTVITPRIYVRIHDSGDYYSAAYFRKWMEICRDNPDIQFYSYTKMVRETRRWVQSEPLPTNLTLIYSLGGTQDHRINMETDRHSAVFPDADSLEAAGYANAMDNDLVAVDPTHNRVGLIYHGAQSRAWEAR